MSTVSCVRLIALLSLFATARAAAAENPLANHVRAAICERAHPVK